MHICLSRALQVGISKQHILFAWIHITMMDLLRGFSKGWVAKILIALLIGSFAIWGVSSSILFGPASNVVQVGDTNITAQEYRFAYDNQLNAMSQQAGRRITRQEADVFGLRNSVLAQVTSGAVLDENTRTMGLGLSDEALGQEIANDPTFQDLSGTFSRNTLRATLRQYGLTEDEYIQDRKRVALRNQILQGTSASLDMPEVFTQAIAQFRNEKRVFDYVAIGEEVLKEKPDPTESEISDYYEANKPDYMAPEYRKLTLLSLQASDIVKPQEITEDELKTAYEARKNNLRSPETRRVEQLVLKDKSEADSVKEKLTGGTPFEDVVKELGKTIQDIDLGLVTKTELPDSKVSEAAFAAELNKPTDVIDGLFGPVIVRVSEIKKETTTAYDDVKDQLRNELALQKAGDEVFNTFDAVEDERAAGSNLADSAKALNLKTRVVTRIDAQGQDENGNAISDIPALQQLLRVAFDTQPGDDTRELPVGNDGFLWYEVDEIIPTRQKELDEVKSDVKDAWIEEKTTENIQEIAEVVAERIRKGEDMNLVLADALPEDSLGTAVKHETSAPLARNAQEPKIGNAAISEGFNGKKGDVKVASAIGTNFIVLRIADVQAPEDNSVPEEALEQLNSAASDDILTQVVQDMQSRLDVSVNPNALEAAFNPYAGGGQGH